jgi:ankyrin repeat protein
MMRKSIVLLLVAFFCISAFPVIIFAADVEKSRAKLEGMGVPFTVAEFFKAIRGDDKKLAALFIDAGMDPDACNKLDRPALIMAIEWGSEDVFRVLIKKGADLNVSESGWTPLVHAAYRGYMKPLKALLKAGADVNKQSEDDGTTALIHAAQKGKETAVMFLLKAGADIGLKDKWGRTALDNARKRGQKGVVEILEKAKKEAEEKARKEAESKH